MDTTAQSHLLSRGLSHEFTSSRPSILILYIRPPAGCTLPMFLLTSMPQKPLSSVRQHRVIIIRPDGDNVTQSVYFLAACIQLQPLSVCCTCDVLPIMGSSNARSTSVACLVWLCSSRCRPDSLGESPEYRPEHTPPRETSEGQAQVARRPENEVRTTRIQSPAITQQFPQLVVTKLIKVSEM